MIVNTLQNYVNGLTGRNADKLNQTVINALKSNAVGPKPVEFEAGKQKNGQYSAHHFCFDKTLGMISNRGILSQHNTQ